MAPVAALAAGFSVIGRYVPRFLARRFRIRLEAPTVRADPDSRDHHVKPATIPGT